MKAFIVVVLLLWSGLYGAEPYAGERFNARFAWLNECAFLFVENDYDSRTGLIGGYGHCDLYTDKSYEIFQRSYSLLGGVGRYSGSIFRDGYFMHLMAGAEFSELETIHADSGGSRLSIVPILALGYQWQFRRGFNVALGSALQVRIPLWAISSIDEDAEVSAKELRRLLATPEYAFRPFLLFGWRF